MISGVAFKSSKSQGEGKYIDPAREAVICEIMFTVKCDIPYMGTYAIKRKLVNTTIADFVRDKYHLETSALFEWEAELGKNLRDGVKGICIKVTYRRGKQSEDEFFKGQESLQRFTLNPPLMKKLGAECIAVILPMIEKFLQHERPAHAARASAQRLSADVDKLVTRIEECETEAVNKFAEAQKLRMQLGLRTTPSLF